MNKLESIIIENTPVAENTFLLSLECGIGQWSPGQFVMLGLTENLDPFLRRPLGIMYADDRELKLLYKVVGRGTRNLSAMDKGGKLSVLGPLGNGFTLPEEDTLPLMVAGGTGLPPIYALSGRVMRGVLIAGARSKKDLPMEILKENKGEMILVTEDGSAGSKGLVTAPLEEALGAIDGEKKIYACGPAPMLKAVSMLAAEFDVPCEISLEERMGCGFGVCSGCAVGTKDGIKRACKDGPVFDATEIVWDWKDFI